MESIALPKKIVFKDGDKSNQGIVTIEPCYPGYGMTLGSSLRRVLLSSLVGSAVIGVKIKGADHEFMTLPHVKEDVLEILLNLKKLKMKVHSEEVIKLELEVAGTKTVTAADITKNSQVEIANPKMVIANIVDMAGSLNMEIHVGQGRGYRPVEAIEEKNSEIGYINMDSIFSPVLFVGLNVSSVRVGKMTNWDKLELTIETDGVIDYKQAFEEATKILINQFSSLGKTDKKDKKEDKKSEETKEAKEEKEEEIKEDKTDKK